MSFKTNYSHEEWSELLKGPYFAGSYVSLADTHSFDQRRERHAMVKDATLWEIPDPAKDLIRALYTDIGKFREDNDEIPGYVEGVDKDEQRSNSLQGLKDVSQILSEKATSEEIAAYKDWLMFIAQKTAESSKESPLGIFGSRVSHKEQAALDEIREALGIS